MKLRAGDHPGHRPERPPPSCHSLRLLNSVRVNRAASSSIVQETSASVVMRHCHRSSCPLQSRRSVEGVDVVGACGRRAGNTRETAMGPNLWTAHPHHTAISPLVSYTEETVSLPPRPAQVRRVAPSPLVRASSPVLPCSCRHGTSTAISHSGHTPHRALARGTAAP